MIGFLRTNETKYFKYFYELFLTKSFNEYPLLCNN